MRNKLWRAFEYHAKEFIRLCTEGNIKPLKNFEVHFDQVSVWARKEAVERMSGLQLSKRDDAKWGEKQQLMLCLSDWKYFLKIKNS